MRYSSNVSRIIRIQTLDDEPIRIGEPLLAPAQKDAQPEPLPAGPSIEDAIREADNILADAEEAAARKLSDAALKANQMLQEARTEGYKKGYEEGLAIAQEETRQNVEAITRLANNLTVDKRELMHMCEREISELAIRIARKIIHQEVTADPRIVKATLDTAIERVSGQVIGRVRVSPADYEMTKSFWEEDGHIADGSHPEIVPDKRIKPGGCIIDTQGGHVDAQIDTQLAEIKKSFLAADDSSERGHDAAI